MKKFFTGGSIYGKLILLVGFLNAVPLSVIPFYPDEARYARDFLIPSLLSIVLGLAVYARAPRKEKPAAEWRSPLANGSLPVMLTWCCAFITGALPFITGGRLSVSLALFESVSGWTTTGLTVSDVAELPRVFLFHRAFMQYCGGLGFIIMIAMLIRGKQNMSLYSAEGHPDRLMPSLRKTSRIIFTLYGCFLILGTLAYRLFGMGLFDAVCHTMSALSTAGFTTRAKSIGHYGSLPIEAVTIALMLIGGTNFAILLLFVKRKFKTIARVSEVRFMTGLLLVFVPLAAFSLIRDAGLGFGESVMNALFGVVTTFTTSGYSTMDYSVWPPFALGLLIVLMVIGGSVGSTAGGVKLLRVYLLVRVAKENVRARLMPARRVTAPVYCRAQGKALVTSALINDTVGFVCCYIAIIIAGTLLLTLTADCSLFDAIFEFTSAFGTVGISNGLTNAGASAGTLAVLMAGMILGRLEIFIVFIGAYSGIKIIAAKIKTRFFPIVLK